MHFVIIVCVKHYSIIASGLLSHSFIVVASSSQDHITTTIDHPGTYNTTAWWSAARCVRRHRWWRYWRWKSIHLSTWRLRFVQTTNIQSALRNGISRSYKKNKPHIQPPLWTRRECAHWLEWPHPLLHTTISNSVIMCIPVLLPGLHHLRSY